MPVCGHPVQPESRPTADAKPPYGAGVIPARAHTDHPSPGPPATAAPWRSGRYERLTRAPLTVLGLLFLGVYAWPILDTDVGRPWRDLCSRAATAIWLAFAYQRALAALNPAVSPL